MSDSTFRSLFAELLIAVAACAGGYLMIVDPMERNLSEARGEAQRVAAAVLTASPAHTRADVERLRALACSAEAASAPARDELDAFSMLMQRAEESGVRVEQLQQRTTPRSATTAHQTHAEPAPGPAPGGQALPPTAPDARIGFTMTVNGTFDQVLALVHLLQHRGGFTRIESMRLLPAGDAGNPIVSASIDTVHVAFDTRAAMASTQAALDFMGHGGAE